MTKCGDCGKHEGSWYNNRNNEIYCSACVGDKNFIDLIKIIKRHIKINEESKSNLDFSMIISELRLILAESNFIEDGQLTERRNGND